jgi:hypothetical protein
MSAVEQLARAIETLSQKDFEMLVVWIDEQRRLRMPSSTRVPLSPEPVGVRDHSAFLNSYSPEDEGLYDDAKAG